MTNLHYVLDAITVIDNGGNISFKNYSENLINKINNKVILINPEKRCSLHEICFKDKRFSFENGLKPISFNSLSKEFEYELKAICLSLVFIGKKRDFKKIKWSSFNTLFPQLKKISLILMSYNLNSFRDLNKLKPLELQQVFKRLNESITNKADYLNSILSILENYSLISPRTYQIFLTNHNCINSNSFDENNKSNSYPIIPDHTLLKTFEEIEKYKIVFLRKYKFWLKYYEDEITNIKNGNYIVKNGEYISRRQHDSIKGASFISFLNKFRKVVVFNTLLFTGMRKDEAKELKNSCLFENDETFYITSSLNKTVVHKLENSWISSQSCNETLNLLIEINKKVKERVHAVLNTQDSRFSAEYIFHLKTNLKNDNIFSFNYSLNYCRFDTLQYIKTTEMNKNHAVFKIALDQHDIEQLDFLDCNYKSSQKGANDYMVKYNVGDYFNFSPHQFRHTFAYFMISNNLCTIREIKHQFKHLMSAMTFIYTRRGIYAEIINQSESLDEIIKVKSLMGFSNAIAQQNSAGGGVKFILNSLNLKDFKYNISIDPLLLNDLNKINSYLQNNKDSINFLPHGFCMNGSDCSFKSIAEPLSCINCHGYVTTNVNLPFWKGLLEDVNTKLTKLYQLSNDHRAKFGNLILNLEKKEKQLSEIIHTLSKNKIDVTPIEVI